MQEDNEGYESCSEEGEIDLPMIHTRIINFGPIVQLRNLKSNYFGIFKYHYY